MRAPDESGNEQPLEFFCQELIEPNDELSQYCSKMDDRLFVVPVRLNGKMFIVALRKESSSRNSVN